MITDRREAPLGHVFFTLVCALFVASCAAPDASPDASTDPGRGDADAPDGGVVTCTRDEDCSDGIFCNGSERCEPTTSLADARGCVSASEACRAGQRCDEGERRCVTECAVGADADGDGHFAAECGGDDCDDTDPLRFPGNTEVCDATDRDEDCDPTTFGYRDTDGDLYVDARCCNDGGDGTSVCGDDCNDSRPNVHPALPETCDGLDNDCDGSTDEEVQRVFHPDADGDGYGDDLSPDATPIRDCFPPSGYSELGGDCDDENRSVHPGALEQCDGASPPVDENCDGVANPPALCSCNGDITRACEMAVGLCSSGTERCVGGAWGLCSIAPGSEVCNGQDEDCDGRVDESLTVTCYADADNDGFPSAGAPSFESCPVPGREAVGGCPPSQTGRAPFGEAIDCADLDAARRPFALEVCNGLDDDCDGMVDEGVLRRFYPDLDGDLFGDGMTSATLACTAPPGMAENPADCDDTRATRNPAAPEVCDGLDNNCNGEIDESGSFLVFRDRDNDSWGDAADARAGCGTPPPGYAVRGGDCDDGDAARFPGAPEVCDNRDNDCNPATYYPGDLDRDGHDPLSCGGADCNESDPTVYGGAPELCDRKDNNCSSGGGADTREDADNDGFAPIGASCVGGRPATDCDDGSRTTNPGAPELCNGRDDDCDGSIDELPAAAASCGFTGAVATCAAGACTFIECLAPYLDCDRTIGNGCEVDPRTDLGHCGGCGFACEGPAGQVYCAEGACTDCPTSFGNCDGDLSNLCETDLTSTLTHCGACGRRCNLPNANAACADGECVIASCRPPFADCDGNPANGCEVNLQTAIGNCGTCGNTCLVAANATPSCVSGVCGAGACAPGYHLCGIQCVPNDSVFSCGSSCSACPGASNGTASCNGSVCALACLPNTGDCDGNPANGCETALLPGQQCCGGSACSGRCLGGVTCVEPSELSLANQTTCGIFADGALRCVPARWSDEDVASFRAAVVSTSSGGSCGSTTTYTSTGVTSVCRHGVNGFSGSSRCTLADPGLIVIDSREDFRYPTYTVLGLDDGGATTIYQQSLGDSLSMNWPSPFYGPPATALPSPMGSFEQIVLSEEGAYGSPSAVVCGRMASGSIACSDGYLRTGGVASVVGGSRSGGAYRFCHLLTDGTVECRAGGAPTAIGGLTEATQLSFGRTHSCARRSDGTAMCWGSNANGMLGDGTTMDSPSDAVLVTEPVTGPVESIEAALTHTCVLQADGTTRCWGSAGAWLGSGCAPAPQETSWPTATGVSLGTDFACVAGPTAGTTQCVGANASAQLGDGTFASRSTFAPVSDVTDARAVVASPAGRTACAVSLAGTAACWGENQLGQVGYGTITATPILTPRAVLGVDDIEQLVLGATHGCARRSDGSVWCWGGNASGQLGDGTTTNRGTPAAVPGLSGAVSLTAGDNFTCAALADGSARCWGGNGSGQLGDGTRANKLVPTRVLLLDGATSLVAGSEHVCALRTGGGLRCWGRASEGQLGNGSRSTAAWPVDVRNLTGATAIVAGHQVSCARTPSGWSCWGLNTSGQLGVGDTTNRLLPSTVAGLPADHAVVPGVARTCAVAPDGGVSCWGDNGGGTFWPNATTTTCAINWGTI